MIKTKRIMYNKALLQMKKNKFKKIKKCIMN